MSHILILKWSENANDYQEKELRGSRKVLHDQFSISLERIQLDIYVAAMIEFRDATNTVRTPFRFSSKFLSAFNFQSDAHCKAAVKADTQKLRSNLNTNLAKLCQEMPQLFARLAGEYPTDGEVLDRVKKMSDKVFSESAEAELNRVRGVLTYHLEH